MILHFAYIGAALLALALLSAWMFIVSHRHLVERIGGAMIVLALAFSIWTNVTSILGYAVPDDLPSGKLQVVGLFDDSTHDRIYLWILEADGPRAYVVPYSEGLANGLIKAQHQVQAAGGGRVMITENGHAKAKGKNHAGGAGLGHDTSHGFNIEIIPALPPKS